MNNRRPLPLRVPLILVSLMWLVLLGTTAWAWVYLHPGTTGGGSPPVQLELDPEGMSRLIQKVQSVGLISVGVLAVLILVGLSMGERKRTE